MVVSTRPHLTRDPKNKARLKKLSGLLSKFPVGTEIAYSWEPHVTLGTVKEHEVTNVRLMTDKGGSHDPSEVTKYVPKEK